MCEMPAMKAKILRSAALLAAPLLLPAAALAQASADPGAFVQDYEPAPAMWLLEDEDTKIYMLGTIHILPQGFRWRNAQIDTVIDTADELVVETSDDDSMEMMMNISPKLSRFLDNRQPTSEQLSPDTRAKWRALARLTGTPFSEIDVMPVALAMISFGTGDDAELASYDYGVETVLEREFASTGRPISSIEDFGTVLYGLYRENDAEMVAELDATLRAWDGKSPETFFKSTEWADNGDIWWMEHEWARGEVAEDFDLGLADTEIGKVLNEVLIVRRNTQWARWLDDRLDTPGTVLVAVGAGHFLGEESVLVELRERGLTAQRIN